MPIPNVRGSGFLAASLLAALWTVLAGAQISRSAETLFLAENQATMEKMMTGMRVKATGDVDQDFAEIMIPHHQGAIDMAQSELRHGKNEQLRRIAQEIIVEQQQEIAAMRLAVKQPLPPSIASPDEPQELSPSAAAPPALR